MAKRYLPPGYRVGAETLVAKLREWRADPEHNYPLQTAAKIREAVTSLDGAERAGFEDSLALLFHMYAFEGCGPLFESWDPIPELEDPDYLPTD
ncbi:hypothetical protein [Burkholderia pyrrocinia]|uniref:hypothetical protein n=1 Tax=Burkholderia pyrrocinia TaxID=60550 RepID=UPI001BCB5487|nr:hypothetical protein [Burkholderia pyrrocinia]QVN18738.1 hypothetical protein JYG32_03100 [Burkholderia pyrrocinia]